MHHARWLTLSSWCTSRNESSGPARRLSTNQVNVALHLARSTGFLTWGSYADAGAEDVCAEDGGVLGGADVGADVVGADVGALDVGEAWVGDGEADERWLGDADALADWDVPAGAEAGALAGCDVPWDDAAAALAEEDALREAAGEEDGEPDTPGVPRPPDVDAAAEDVSPAGD